MCNRLATAGPLKSQQNQTEVQLTLKFCVVTENHVQVGDSYVVYENEILHNRRLIPDGPNVISRDSNFK